MLPFSFRHAFFTILFDFQLIFLIFNKHEQTSWFQTMEFIESTHAKLIRALVGAQHSWYPLPYCLLDIWLIFYSPWWYTWIFFVFIVEISLLPIEMWMLANQVRPFYPITLKFLWIGMFSWDMTMFDAIIDCLDACLIVFDENTYYVSYFQTNL